MKRHIWLPVSWSLSFFLGIGLAGFFIWWLGPAFIAAPGKQLPSALGLAFVFIAPLLLEARVASRRGDGPIRVLTPFRRFEAPVAGTWLDVGWDHRQKFVVWHTPRKDVRLAWCYTSSGAIRAAEEISQTLGIPHRTGSAIEEAAQLETRSQRTGLFIAIAILLFVVVVAGALQVFLFTR